MIKLEKDKEYILENFHLKYIFKLEFGPGGYFLQFPTCLNNVLFERYSIDKIAFTTQILGYYDQGIWPFCKTQEDCEKLLYALLEEINKIEDISFYCKSEIENLKDYWND